MNLNQHHRPGWPWNSQSLLLALFSSAYHLSIFPVAKKYISFYIYNLEDKPGQQTVIPVTKTLLGLGLLQTRTYMSSGLNR